MTATCLIRLPKKIKDWLAKNKQDSGSSINWQINKILEAQILKEKKKGK